MYKVDRWNIDRVTSHCLHITQGGYLKVEGNFVYYY
jgi:hypothetical protein